MTAIPFPEIPLFAGFTPATLDAIQSRSRENAVPAHTMIFRQNDPVDAMYIILSGQVEIINEEQGIQTSILDRYDFFGEMALLHTEKRNATATALTDCHLLVIDQKLFSELIQIEPDFAVRVGNSFVERFKENKKQARMEELFGNETEQ